MKGFQVIIDGPRHPRLNMELDRLLLDRAKEGYVVLRLYQWYPPGVSLGRRQDPEDSVDLDAIEREGYVLVRRPTGGATLIHESHGELTYSVVVPRDHYLYRQGVDSSSETIAGIIAEAMRTLGIPVVVGEFQGVPNEKNMCLLRSGFADLTLNGQKISGSAQYRDSRGLLQHGSILLDYDPSKWVRMIRITSNREYAYTMVTGLWDSGYHVQPELLANAIISSFSENLGAPPNYVSFTVEELDKALVRVLQGELG